MKHIAATYATGDISWNVRVRQRNQLKGRAAIFCWRAMTLVRLLLPAEARVRRRYAAEGRSGVRSSSRVRGLSCLWA